MIPGSLARRYARALLGLAETPAQRDAFAQHLDAVAELARSRDEAGTPVLSVLTAERFPLSQRKALLETLGRRVGADPTVLKFLDVVLDNGRGEGIPDIARTYRRMADEAAGRLQAHITSAAPLAPDALARITAALERATGKTIVATSSVDPELIGGIVARVGSWVIDGSVRASLQQLRASLRS